MKCKWLIECWLRDGTTIIGMVKTIDNSRLRACRDFYDNMRTDLTQMYSLDEKRTIYLRKSDILRFEISEMEDDE